MFGGALAFGNTDWWEGKTLISKNFTGIAAHFKGKVTFILHALFTGADCWVESNRIEIKAGKE